MPTPPRRRGFSLIELVVVMTIIAILLTIVVGGINKIRHAQRRGEAVSRLQTIATALREYRQDWGDVPVYNPTLADLNGDGSPVAGPGLYALLLCDYLTLYRFLNDPGSRIDKPWIDNGGSRLEVIPGDPTSEEAAYNAKVGAIANPGGDLTPGEEWQVYSLLADPATHRAPGGVATDFGKFEEYDELGNEN
ncbi:MAG: type II secretion system protein, partial [Armatimonadetes bacterium]|nr:type II secretion system protein [Armatimonadota bacterium]